MAESFSDRQAARLDHLTLSLGLGEAVPVDLVGSGDEGSADVGGGRLAIADCTSSGSVSVSVCILSLAVIVVVPACAEVARP